MSTKKGTVKNNVYYIFLVFSKSFLFPFTHDTIGFGDKSLKIRKEKERL